MPHKCVFLDRDGVLNKDYVSYTYRLSRLDILPGIPEALYNLKVNGYLLVVVTNQSGIAQGIYTVDQMKIIHIALQNEAQHVIDDFYFAPLHRSVSASLASKPDTLMFEKAIAKFDIDISKSWMVGDRGRDIIPARTLGIRTIQIGDEIEPEHQADFTVDNLIDVADIILADVRVKGKR